MTAGTQLARGQDERERPMDMIYLDSIRPNRQEAKVLVNFVKHFLYDTRDPNAAFSKSAAAAQEMSAATTQTLHSVSEFLLDRNVFDPNSPESLANFTSVVDVHEVKAAFGRRCVQHQLPKYLVSISATLVQRSAQAGRCACL